MLMRNRRKTLDQTFNKTLEDSRDALKKVEDTLRSQMAQTSAEVEQKKEGRGEYGGSYDSREERQPEAPVREEGTSMKSSNLPPEIHKDLDSEHDYDTPYGTSDRHHFHAVCIDCDGKLVFLSENSKSALSDKINRDDTLDDVIAVYEGKLTYFEERRVIQIR